MDYKYTKNTLQIIPIGGVSEFGMNSMFVRYNDSAFIIDAGAMFPDFEQPGIDMIIPDYSFLIDNGLNNLLKAILITHAHEDHIGALPFLCHDIERDIDVYATRLTCGFIKKKFEEHKFDYKVKLYQIEAGQTLTFNDISVRFIQVTHSIVDCVAMVFTTPAGTFVHTGDFKIDQTPIDDREFDFAGFAEVGKKGVDLLLADSTNVEKEGYTLSEKTVGESLKRIIGKSTQKTIVACFSSHIHRIQQILDIARRLNKKVAILGRSLEKSVEVSKNLGYLKIPTEVLINKKEVSSVPSEKLIIITTGSQGEPMAALSRIVRGENKKIIVEEGDTVIISAKTIPGNEKPVLKIINSLYRKEANVFYEEVSEVHVSGHASKEELKMMFNIVKPKNFIPIHGERKQLFHHAELAKEMGLKRGNIRIIEDGEMVELSDGRIKRTGKVEIKKRFIEGDSFEELEDIILHDRRRIADDGLVIVTLLVEEGTGKLIGDVEVITRGFMLLSDNEEEMEEIKKVVRERFETLEHNLRHDWEYTRPKIRSGLRTYFRKYFRSFPLVLPIILSVSKEELE